MSSLSSSSFSFSSAPDLEALRATAVVRSFAAPGSLARVLDGVDVTAAPGTRVGVIGENGSGKSTLLRILAGLDRPDSGAVRSPADLVYLPQHPPVVAAGTVGGLLAAALEPLQAATAALERLAAALAEGAAVDAEYDRVLAWATQHEAWDADRRAEVVARTLGVDRLDRSRPLASISGGERTRLALAAALVRMPACLILDEPTNHLDAEALDLLESSLVRLPGVVVAASHDRVFLDNVCTEILDLDAGALGSDGRGGRRFGGDFSAYLAQKKASRRRWEATYAAQQEEIAELRRRTRLGTEEIAHNRAPRDNDKFVYHFKGGNVERARARRVRDAERRLEVAERNQTPRPPAPLRFRGELTGGLRDPADRVSGLVVSIRELVVTAADGRLRLQVPELDLEVGGRLLVTGPNGSGKSTLLGVLAGQVEVTDGTLWCTARRTRILAQDPAHAELDRTARQVYQEAVGAAAAEALPLRSLGLLAPRSAELPVGALSVGQRRRLDLAVAIAGAPDLLLLDEPTNHLSLALVDELEEAIGAACGAVVVTSHDRWLRRRWRGATYAL